MYFGVGGDGGFGVDVEHVLGGESFVELYGPYGVEADAGDGESED